MNTIFRSSSIPLLVILCIGFVVRLYAFTAPLGDWHSWRQADTSAVSRNFVNRGYDVLHPRFDDLSNVPSMLDNPEGYRFVEFPLYNLAQAGLYDLFGILTIEEWGRMVSIIASLISTWLLYLMTKKWVNTEAAMLVAFFYAFMPYTIYYGRTILPDTSMVTATLGAIYFFDRWIDETAKNKKHTTQYWKLYVLSLVLSAVALLLKPYALFFFLPILFLAWKRYGRTMLTNPVLWVYLIVSVTPLLLWRQWMLQYPEGIPSNSWLLNGNGIRFRPAFFRWLGYERLVKLISGYFGLIFLFSGLLYFFRLKSRGVLFSFVVSSLLYLTVFATGNVQHDYYQILVMPTVALLFGLGAYYLLESLRKKHQVVGIVVLAGITFLSFSFSWRIVKDYFNINNPDMITAGKVVDTLTPKDAKVIALYNGDTSFLYQTKRQGWANMQNPLPELIKKGADYLVLLHPSSNDIIYYSKGYPIVASSSAFVVIELQ